MSLNEKMNWSQVKRYLQSKVGQPWDQVWSDICKLGSQKIKNQLD